MSTEPEPEVAPEDLGDTLEDQAVDLEEIEREPAPAAEAPAAVAPPAPAPVHPEAERGVSDGSLVCTVCLGLIGAGEAYVQTDVRGFNHLDPCSHRA